MKSDNEHPRGVLEQVYRSSFTNRMHLRGQFRAQRKELYAILDAFPAD
ncbi:hypothetical protein HRUBRA_02615 [Pseudohaliea rubra DSM 19751]|uniref:Uncharacterized protein n=1 Tax=Pseudohaliea rubra DSM 19751 TaxID=1265313 RepID=A0A095VMU5_9GAMM|nr:hypothetical protein HRUBRA_02615 [Pseudohaliea rubra DSM 19751]